MDHLRTMFDFSFTNSAAAYTPPANSVMPYAGLPPAIYVSGDAQFDAVNMNVAPAGAVIIDGNLTMANNGGVGTPNSPIYPSTAYLEDPYHLVRSMSLVDQRHSCRCFAKNMQIQGFLYVTGNLTIPSTSAQWTIYGVLRVDGGMTLATNLNMFYNDGFTNHNIKVTNFELQIDSTTAITAQ